VTSDEMKSLAVINGIASAMMDVAIDTMRKYPPAYSFEAAMGILFFVGEKTGLTPEQVAALVHDAANGLTETEDDA